MHPHAPRAHLRRVLLGADDGRLPHAVAASHPVGQAGQAAAVGCAALRRCCCICGSDEQEGAQAGMGRRATASRQAGTADTLGPHTSAQAGMSLPHAPPVDFCCCLTLTLWVRMRRYPQSTPSSSASSACRA